MNIQTFINNGTIIEKMEGGTLNIINGKADKISVTSKKVKDAIEATDKAGLLTDGTLWWAIYRVLTMPEYGYPTSKPEFCKSIENLGVAVSRKCIYNNWRNVSPHKLSSSPDKWESIENLGELESRQRRVGMYLLEQLSHDTIAM